MITAGDVQYEPQQRKAADISANVLLAIAGDFSIHSQAIKDTHKQLRGKTEPDPYDVALIYGQAIQGIKRRHAEDLYLSPLGLNTDTFIAQQSEMSDELTNALLDRLQSYRGEDVEAIIVGTSQPVGASQKIAQIYTVDTAGSISCCDDVGFAAIGIGAWHAKSRLMQSGYVNNRFFAPAIAVLYAAKKAAEIAPGVGRATDILMIMRDGHFPLWDHMHKRLEEIYEEYSKAQGALALQAIVQVNEALAVPQKTEIVEAQGQAGQRTKPDSHPDTEAQSQRLGQAGPGTGGDQQV